MTKDINPSNNCIICKAKCCKHIAIEIDTPTNKKDYDNIRWYLLHKNVIIFIDDENKWTIEFITKCEWLSDDHSCMNYDKRPLICRNYPDKDSYCEYEGDEEPYKIAFHNVNELETYLTEKNIEWQWKRLSK